jgi:hypothetical protein
MSKRKPAPGHQLRGRASGSNQPPAGPSSVAEGPSSPFPVAPQAATASAMINVNDLSDGLGFDRIRVLPGSTYKDSSTVVIVPERNPMIHHRIVTSWQNLISPMNQKRTWIFAIGDEVGQAYNNMISNILADPNLSKWKYVLTLESDNIVPPDAHVRLLESIEEFNFDAVSGIYFTKGDVQMPMAYGDPEEFKRTGVLDFRPRDIREAVARGRVMEVNGIAMGCSLYRLDLFRELPPPWFVTVADVVEGKGAMGFTQDLYFCQRAKLAGKKFGVDFRCRVGHLDIASGTVY